MASATEGRVKLPWRKGGPLWCNLCGKAAENGLVPVGSQVGRGNLVRLDQTKKNLEYVLLVLVCETCARRVDRGKP